MGGKKEFSVAHLSLIWFFFFLALSFLLSILSYTALFSLFVFGFSRGLDDCGPCSPSPSRHILFDSFCGFHWHGTIILPPLVTVT